MVFGVQGFAAWYWFGPSAYLAQELVLFSIDDRIWSDQREAPSFGCLAKAWRPSDVFARPDDMISKRRFSKGTFGSEMHLIP